MKILIVHASAGAGHKSAAEAIGDGIKGHSSHDSLVLDALDKTSPAFKNLYRTTYTTMITHVPWLWGAVFRLLDIKFLQGLVRSFRRLYNAMNMRVLHRFLIDEQFDVIISTHFMPVEVVSALKRSGKVKSKLICVVTDFDVHKIWLGSGVDTYCVASDWTKKRLTNFGVSSAKIVATGIPTHEKFSAQKNIGELKRKIGLAEDKFTVLVATGSFGIGPIEEIVNALIGFQIIVVCGHNKDLYERLKGKDSSLVKIMGLVNNMHELMAVADVMVTKPGGLSINEALVSQLPMVFFNAIPGQETNNIKILKEHDIGINTETVQEIVKALNAYKSSKDLFLTAVRNTKALARPRAVQDIINLIK